jgi:hypothetical protein
MARLRHIVCAFFICASFLDAGLYARAQNAPPPDTQNPPAARLIKPRADARPVERVRPKPAPLDERCRALKDQLEGALQKHPNAHRVFQARLAHNAGTRLCREGQPERGMAEFQKGLSYLPDYHP